ncbi:hypothetical protein Cni_G10525 [Canna indica]|uniref:Uncharacterized protein n=1 Tax=Canna indica TaxID=4628 RepID=A0AAQ3K6T4_9LILI|nr:hypothetical protein Cni_G10525 [Canna indica]
MLWSLLPLEEPIELRSPESSWLLLNTPTSERRNRNVLDLPNTASQEGKQKEKRSPRRSAPLLHTKLKGFVGPYRLRTAPLSPPHPLPVADSMPARPSAAAAAAHLDFLPIKVVLFFAKRGGVICLLPRQPLDPTFRSRNRMT